MDPTTDHYATDRTKERGKHCFDWVSIVNSTASNGYFQSSGHTDALVRLKKGHKTKPNIVNMVKGLVERVLTGIGGVIKDGNKTM